MTIKTLFGLFRLLLMISAALNAKAPSTTAEVQASAAFSQIKSLIGEWQAIGAKGDRSRLVYELISGGSAVMERFSSEALPPNSGAMVTIYYLDGDQLVLTHYCIAHNQPHMRASRYNPGTGELEFTFVSGGNMPTGNEGHMHNARFRFIDHDHITAEWQYVEAGSAGFAESWRFSRIRDTASAQ
jgi:hypothetical protein